MRNQYTDSPKLYENPILSSLQLFVWFLFHPTAWRNNLLSIDPYLNGDFALSSLDKTLKGNKEIKRLLLAGYVIWPITIGTTLSVFLWLFVRPGQICLILAFNLSERCFFVNWFDGILYGLTFGLIAGLIIGWLSSIACGITTILIVTIATSLSWVTGSTPILLISYGIMAGLTNSIAGSVIANKSVRISNPAPDSSNNKKDFRGTYLSRKRNSEGYIFANQLIKQASSSILSALLGIIIIIIAITIPVIIIRNLFNSGYAFTLYGIVLGTIVATIFALIENKNTDNLSSSSLRWHGIGIVSGLFAGFLFDISENKQYINSIVIGFQTAAAGSALFVIAYEFSKQTFNDSWIGITAAAIASGGGGIAASLTQMSSSWPISTTLFVAIFCIVTGLTFHKWFFSVSYLPSLVWNFFLFYLDKKRSTANLAPSLLRWHTAFWDECQWLPLWGLDHHLILVMERNKTEGQAALNYLSTSRQRWAAQIVQIELDARYLECLNKIEDIDRAYKWLAAGELEGPASALLRSFSHISQDVEAAFNQVSTYHQRLALKTISDRLNGLLRELNRSNERYAPRFRPIAVHWQRIIDEQITLLIKNTELHQEIDNPYIIGVPLTAYQELFVGRTDISRQIESLLLDRRRPPLLLYGQRRMGKTSLLNNLGRLLPNTIIPLFVDLQGPVSYASDHAGLLYNVARSMIRSAEKQRNVSLPSLTRDALTADPFTTFDEWLDKVEAVLPQQMILLALDEFEALDSGFQEGRFSERAVLSLLRHIIQHRFKFKVLLAGSHTLDEFQRWSTYLINAQVVPINYLSESEARQLIIQPVKDFTLRYLPQATQRVIQLTRNHPFLIQLLCGEIIALKNEQEPDKRQIVTVSNVETAVPRALSRGSMFFADIEQNQVSSEALPFLQLIAQEDGGAKHKTLTQYAAGSACDLEQILAQLFQRELIEEAKGVYRFHVELVRLWFRHKLSFSSNS